MMQGSRNEQVESSCNDQTSKVARLRKQIEDLPYKFSRKRYIIENIGTYKGSTKTFLYKLSSHILSFTKEKQSFLFSQIISHLRDETMIQETNEIQNLINAADKLSKIIKSKNISKKKDMYITQEEYYEFVKEDDQNLVLIEKVKKQVLRKISEYPEVQIEVELVRKDFLEKKNMILMEEYKKFDKHFTKLNILDPNLFKQLQKQLDVDPKFVKKQNKIEESFKKKVQQQEKIWQDYQKQFSDKKGDISLTFEVIKDIKGQLEKILGCNKSSKNKILIQINIMLLMMSQNLEVNNHPINKNLNTNIEKKEEAYNLGEQLQIKGSIGDEQIPLEEQQYIDSENMSHKEQQKLQQTKQDNIQENDIYHNNQYNNMGLNDIQVHSIDIAPQLRNFSEDDDQQYGQQDECLYDIIEKYMEN